MGHKDGQESGSGGQLNILPHCSHSLLRVRPGASDAPHCPAYMSVSSFHLRKLFGGIERKPLPSCTHLGAFRTGALSHDAPSD